MAEKKFEPLDKHHQSDEQRKKVLWINNNWMDHPLVNVWFGRFEEWIEWLYGNQYIIYEEERKKLVDIEPEVLKSRDVTNVYNRILPMVRQIWSEIRFPHEFYVIPNTTESEDVRASHLSSDIIEYTNDKRKFNLKINRSKFWVIVTGLIFWKEWWNASAKGLAEGKGSTAVPVDGDVDYGYVIPFNARPDPAHLERDGWRYFIEGKLVPQSSLEAEFNLPSKTLPTVKQEEKRKGLFIGETLEDSKEPMCLRIECHEVPYFSEGHDKGRFIVTCGDWILWDKENNTPDNELSYFQLPGLVPKLNEPVYDSAVRIAQPAQRQFNRMNSQIDEQIENYKLKGFYPRGSMLEGDLNAWKRIGVDFVEYNPRLGQPNWQSPPSVPKDVLDRVTSMEREIDTSVSVREPSYGRIPRYGTRASGKLFEQLLGRDVAVLAPNVEDMDEELRPIMRHRLRLIEKHYSENRLVKTVGRNRIAEVKYFKGADLRGNTDVRIKPGMDLLRNKQKREDIIFAFIEKGIIQDPTQAIEFLENRSFEDIFEEQLIDETQARRYLDTMKTKNEYIQIEREDNLEVHYRIFNNFRKTEEFTMLPKTNQDNIKKRAQELKRMIDEAQRVQAVAAQPATAEEEMPLAASGPVESEGASPAGVPAEALALIELARQLEGGGA